MKVLFVLLVFSLISLHTNAQIYDWLKPKLANADTIVLASHDDLRNPFNRRVNSDGISLPIPEWVVSGRPNYKVLLKHKILTPAQRVEISHILVRPFLDKSITTMHCCQPHNILFLIHHGHTSYLDICFSCRCLDSSPDLAKLYAFDNRKWRELEKFFTKLGLEHGF